MLKQKCLQYLQSLQPSECKLLDDYLQSPLFNKDEKIVMFFRWIQKNCKSFDITEFNASAAAQSLFPKSKNKEVALRRVLSKMVDLLEGFFVYLQMQEDNTQQQNWLLDFYVERGLHHFFPKAFQQVKKTQAARAKTTDNFYQNFLLETSLYDFTLSSNHRSLHTNLQEVVDKFEIFYVSNKLRYYCEMLNKTTILAGEYHFFLLEELLKKIAQNEEVWLNEPIIQIYHAILLMLKEKEEIAAHHFVRLKKLLQEKTADFAKMELYYMYTFATSYCVNKFRKTGNNYYLKELFELYQQMINKELLIDQQLFTLPLFQNIIITAARLGEFAWATTTIEQQQHKLPVSHQNNAANYCRGILAFYQKQYDEALVFLNQVNFVDFFDHLNCEMLLLKIHYELDHFTVLATKIDSLRMYINRSNKMATNDKKAYTNFVRLFKRLLRIAENRKRAQFSTSMYKRMIKDTTKLNQNIIQTEPLIDKTWLLACNRYIAEWLSQKMNV